MRRFSADMLPQFINVLMGDLSLFDKQRRISLS
jgi:lipopolysaccharide/colanic/teichoic acid biosynthesis glycosyltransferase